MNDLIFDSLYDLERIKEPKDLLKKILLIADDITDNKKEFISVVFNYILGNNPVEIKDSFPHLTLSQINGFLQIVEIELGVNWVEILKLRVLNKGMRVYSRDFIDKKEQVLESDGVMDKYFDFINLE